MLSILNINPIISAVIGVFLIPFLILFYFSEINLMRIISTSVSITTVLVFIINLIWSKIWDCIPILNEWVFPNLNGDWEIAINWKNIKGDAGKVEAKCKIKQSLFNIKIDIENDSSHSSTLSVSPRREISSGHIFLGYIYQNTIHAGQEGKEPETFYGAANLRVISIKELKGNYFTSKQGQGTFTISRT